jgi:hypothetical protein
MACFTNRRIKTMMNHNNRMGKMDLGQDANLGAEQPDTDKIPVIGDRLALDPGNPDHRIAMGMFLADCVSLACKEEAKSFAIRNNLTEDQATNLWYDMGSGKTEKLFSIVGEMVHATKGAVSMAMKRGSNGVDAISITDSIIIDAMRPIVSGIMENNKQYLLDYINGKAEKDPNWDPYSGISDHQKEKISDVRIKYRKTLGEIEQQKETEDEI